MTTKKLVYQLTQYNQWRRGVNDEMSSPKDIGEWIDEACEKLIDMEQQLDEARKEAEYHKARYDLLKESW